MNSTRLAHPDDKPASSPDSGSKPPNGMHDSVQAPRISSARETLRQLLRTAHPHRAAFARSLWMLVAAASLQGLAMSCLIPIFQALLPAGAVPLAAPASPAATASTGGAAEPHGITQLALSSDWQAALPWLITFTARTRHVSSVC